MILVFKYFTFKAIKLLLVMIHKTNNNNALVFTIKTMYIFRFIPKKPIHLNFLFNIRINTIYTRSTKDQCIKT